jgi:hypothetical protein
LPKPFTRVFIPDNRRQCQRLAWFADMTGFF